MSPLTIFRDWRLRFWKSALALCRIHGRSAAVMYLTLTCFLQSICLKLIDLVVVRFFLTFLSPLFLYLICWRLDVWCEKTGLGIVRCWVEIRLHYALRLLDIWILGHFKILVLLGPLCLLGRLQLLICQLFFIMLLWVKLWSYFSWMLIIVGHYYTWYLL